MDTTAPATLLSATDVLRTVFAGTAKTNGRGCPVHVIPQGGEPRWMILGDPREALPVLRSWQPWNLGSRLRWRGVLLAVSMGMLSPLPGVQSSSARVNPSYWRQKMRETFEGCGAVIHIGNPSYTRKAILFLLKERRIQWVAKVPLVPAAADAIHNEAELLRRFEPAAFVPRVLFEDRQRGVAVQSWLEGKPVSRGFTAAHVHLLGSLEQAGSSVRVAAHRDEVACQLDQLDLPFNRDALNRALGYLESDELLPAFIEHRDFAPWNLKWIGDGRLGLLDWEWAVTDGLPWQDACRFFYSDDAHFGGPGKVWEAMQGNPLLRSYLEKFAIFGSAIPALTMHYLLRALCMDWRGGSYGLARHSFGQIEALLAKQCKVTVSIGL